MRTSRVLVPFALALAIAIFLAFIPALRTSRDPPVTAPAQDVAAEHAALVTSEQAEKALSQVAGLLGALHVKSDDGRYVALAELSRAAGEFARGFEPGPLPALGDDELRELVEAFDRWDASGRSNAPALAGAVEPGTPVSWGRWARRLITAMADADQLRRETERHAAKEKRELLQARRDVAPPPERAELDAELRRLEAATAQGTSSSPSDRVLTDLDRANAAVFERWRERLKGLLDRLIPSRR